MNEYKPDYVCPPGETIQEALEEREIAQTDFVQQIGITLEHLNEIIEGTAPITPDLAAKLEEALEIPARFWLKYEQRYREYLAQKSPA